MFLQPFLAYQATHTITLTVQSEMTANWEADDQQWTVPLNFLVSKLSSFGPFPASYSIGVGAFVTHPDVGPSWKIRGQYHAAVAEDAEIASRSLRSKTDVVRSRKTTVWSGATFRPAIGGKNV